MQQYINDYLNKMADTKSEATLKGHKSTLYKFAEFVQVEEPVQVLVKDVVKFRNNLKDSGAKAGTMNTMLKRVKLFFEWCVAEGSVDISPAKEVKLLTESEALPKWLTEQEEDLLLKVVKKKYLGTTAKKKSFKELAMILLMLKAGLRVGEVTGLKWSQVQIAGEKGKMIVNGKGNQQRLVPLIGDLVQVLLKYKEVHGTKGEYVFFSQKGDTLTERMVQKMMKEMKDAGGFLELHPHMLRHTFAHNLAKNGMALESIARVLGHMKEDGTPNIAMTIRYTKANDSEIADDLERILSLS